MIMMVMMMMIMMIAQDFLATLSIMERGSLRERMEWVARLYDLDGDGLISLEELEDVIYSVGFVIQLYILCKASGYPFFVEGI